MRTGTTGEHRSRGCPQAAVAAGALVPADAPIADPGAPGRLAPPRSVAAAVGEYLRVLPAETRAIVEMLAVLNLRVPLAQLGLAAEAGSPCAAIEPAVASGLMAWWPEEPTCPVEIRLPLVRDAIYAGIGAARRHVLHARAALLVSESASWAHRVAALDHPDEDLAAELEQLAAGELAGGQLALAATHLRWASDLSPARADRERRLLTAALHLMLTGQPADPALRRAVDATAPSPLRGCVLGTMAFAAGQLVESELRFSKALEQAQTDPDSQPLAALIASRLAATYVLLGDGAEASTASRSAPPRDSSASVRCSAAVSSRRSLSARAGEMSEAHCRCVAASA